MDLFAPKHILIILVVVLLVFGTKKIRNLGPDLGAAFRGFKKAMNGDEDEEQKQLAASAANASAAKQDAEFPDVAAKPSGPPDGKPATHV